MAWGGNADVFIMRADGTGNPPRHPDMKLWDSAPDWSPVP